MRLLHVFILFLILTVGCAINQKTSNNYFLAGKQAESRGDWMLAKSNFEKSLINANLAHAGLSHLAVIYYELGRANGVLCQWDKAQEFLDLAFKADQETNGPIHMNYVELSRLAFDQKKYEEANRWFEKAFVILDEPTLISSDPVGFSYYMKEYAISLDAVGKVVEAKKYNNRAQDLLDNHKNKNSDHERTPYGTQCVRGKS